MRERSHPFGFLCCKEPAGHFLCKGLAAGIGGAENLADLPVCRESLWQLDFLQSMEPVFSDCIFGRIQIAASQSIQDLFV